MQPNPGWTVAGPHGQAHARFTVRDDGDFRVTEPVDELARRRSAFVDLPWVALEQVHGATVVVVEEADIPRLPGDAPRLPGDALLLPGDALVTAAHDVVLSVNVADCAPVALVSQEGVVAAVHAGWRGSAAGVIEAAVDAMRGLGARHIEAWLGPCIHPECYEFGPDDLDTMTGRFGRAVLARTATGAPALDLPMVVAAALGRAGVPLVGAADICTACGGRRFFSHRSRHDASRHALAVWTSTREPT